MNLKNISNAELLLNTKKISLAERKITIEVLHHFKEIEIRSLHLSLSYSSLYEYAIKELGYSEDAAYRRITAMRLLKSLPEIEDKIKEGSLSLTNASKIHKFMRQRDQQSRFGNTVHNSSLKLDSKQEKLDWIETLNNKSSREVEKEIVKHNPELVTREKVRHITEEKIELKLIIDDDLKKQMEHLKNILSHKNPNMSFQELIKYLIILALKKLDPVLKSQQSNRMSDNNLQRNVSGARKVNTNDRNSNYKSRYIPSTLKQEIYMRDKGMCTYTDPCSNKRCTSRHLLQYDHRYPLSLGGETSMDNLRLLCFSHHKYVTANTKEMGL
jgi:5-methylcytosine-specific restriction endonuclease McrA